MIDTDTADDLPADPESDQPQSVQEKSHDRRSGAYKPRPSVIPPKHKSAIRAELRDLVFADLLGPKYGPTEDITEPKVSERYLVGMLAPKQQQVEQEEQDELADAVPISPEEGTPEAETSQKQTMLPSSVGLTFCVAGTEKFLRVAAHWGWYRKEKLEHVKEEPATEGESRPWVRTPVEATTLIPLKHGHTDAWRPNPDQPAVVVRGIIRKRKGDADWSVSLFLINGQSEPEKRKDEAWLFQVAMEVSATTHGHAVFTKRGARRTLGKLDSQVFAEMQALEMAYRKKAEFAVGHGIAIHAEVDRNNPTLATKISTRVIPQYEVPIAIAPTTDDVPAFAGLCLDMQELAETEPDQLAAKLQPITTAYEAWIVQQRAKIGKPGEHLENYRVEAEKALAECERAKSRIDKGIALLASSSEAAEAFRFANRAMWRQRVHSIYALARRQGHSPSLEEKDVPNNRRWRPFQLAFILLNLPGLTDLGHEERSALPTATADLLWFPTGGGKTEAYLGLTAYTLAIRRMQGEVEGRSPEHGIAVLMRYTLRLLTLQQFQRATALICACEAIRREAIEVGENKWGNTPFRIGLWVGNRSTPGTTEASEDAIKQHTEIGAYASQGDPAQLTNCPWCGSEIRPGPPNLRVDRIAGRTLMFCGDPLGRCTFTERKSPGEGLPVVVVDEEIYHLLPSLLIATVDKFAQMPWNGNTQMLFGKVNGYCSRHGFRSPSMEHSDTHPRSGDYPAARTVPHGPLRPPDLIIQDELHLISGPLGTLVGLYETAVDLHCTWTVAGKLVRPKVIASTATIRNAQLQVMKIFARQVSVFPPQGLDAADNFFSVQTEPTEESPGRLYAGICAPGRRLKAVLIRVYLAHLAASEQLLQKYDEAADPWMTLVGYFNSIRELGGMRRLVDDEIKTGLSHMNKRGLETRKIGEPEELTSRRNSGDIPRILDRLEKSFSIIPTKPRPIDVLLATNMLSVGVDVQRLGLMVVANQPKSTAEYIQATSRVGRSFPGFVCTVLNWARPRDVSHYERFEHYHATFYQYVEALSVTPFASRALDRGLAAVVVSGVRLYSSTYNNNLSAANVDGQNQIVKDVKQALINRSEATGPEGVDARVRLEIDYLMDQWQTRARRMTDGARLGYVEARDGQTKALLHAAGDGPRQDFTCLNSLRDVEPMVGLILDDRGFDEPPPAAIGENPTGAPR